MRENRVKRTLSEGGLALGAMVFEFSTTGIARIAAGAGAELVIFDLEHTGWSIETARMFLASARAADLVPLVRVPAATYHLIARPLDVGALGVMVPMVESEEQARLIVEYARYRPQGRRGVGIFLRDDLEEAAWRPPWPKSTASSCSSPRSRARPVSSGWRRSPRWTASTCSGSASAT